MDSLEKLIIVCRGFLNNTYDIEEFQSRIETVLLPDACKYSLEKVRYSACNQLERIMFCSSDSLESDADKVAYELINAAIEEKARLNLNNAIKGI